MYYYFFQPFGLHINIRIGHESPLNQAVKVENTRGSRSGKRSMLSTMAPNRFPNSSSSAAVTVNACSFLRQRSYEPKYKHVSRPVQPSTSDYDAGHVGTGRDLGMQLMDQSLQEAIQAKQIDPDDAFRFATDKAMFQKYVTDTRILPKLDLPAAS